MGDLREFMLVYRCIWGFMRVSINISSGWVGGY